MKKIAILAGIGVAVVATVATVITVVKKCKKTRNTEEIIEAEIPLKLRISYKIGDIKRNFSSFINNNFEGIMMFGFFGVFGIVIGLLCRSYYRFYMAVLDVYKNY